AIAEFISDVQHRAGSDNIVADYLSRDPEADAVTLGIDYSALAESQKLCPSVRDFKTAITGLKLVNHRLTNDGPLLLCDT
ncbi:MAG: hypothetical protein V2I33_23900, partial [Kangiellaceae bacterium]|nr:hypothetical protein [Kangiellaceae bacterium]